MKLIKTETLIDVGTFSDSDIWKKIKSQLYEAIARVKWPPGSEKFVIYPEKKANGVKPIKESFLRYLEDLKDDWAFEEKLDIAVHKRPGKIDAIYPIKELSQDRDVYFAVEWETGNISSSHRALNKMSIGLMDGTLVGGALVLPSRELYKYLTDRIGSYSELEPYFPVWRSLGCNLDEGLLVVIVIEQDGVSKNVPKILKGTNGRALI